MTVIRNPRKAGPCPNNTRPTGAAPVAESGDERDLLAAIQYGNRATRRLAARNLRKLARGAA